MAEGIAFSCLGKTLGGIGEYMVAPIGRQLGYLFCFNNNIEHLETQLGKLETTRQGVQIGVDEANRNVRIIDPNVEAWLTSVNEVTTEVERIIQDKVNVQKGCLNGWCPNLKLRYSLGRKAMKKTQVLGCLQAEGINYTQLSYNPPPPPPPCMESIPTIEFKGFESRISTMDEIIENLKNDEINLIGICGMGGIGKTTMVYEVAKRVKEENLFHEIPIAVVKPHPDMKKIQKDIAEMLGLDELDKKENLIARANLLRKRLLPSEENKRILVILDDVWEEFNLNDVGIPLASDSKGCKILYTSRNQYLWDDVRTKKDIPLKLLSKEEAWKLFKEKAGDSAEAPDLQQIAKQIVNECGCLPLALVIIGSALSKKSRGNFVKHIWEDMLHRLTCSSSTPADKRLSSSLELSYTYLEDEEAKRLFLLCCILEEDYDIPIENLARYGMGLSMYEGINDLGKVRHRVFALVDDLKSSYLLLDSNKDECVKVHDVVRDVGISIASRDKGALVSHGVISEWPKKDTYENHTSISVISKKITELPQGLRCPNLEFLLLACWNSKIPSNFFKGMGKLKVLELKSRDIPLLTSSLQFLTNLRTLCLDYCYKFDNISVIGELLNLDILSFRHSSIKELPVEIGRLVNLRLLDLTGCRHLNRILPGVISGLIRLEELYMSSCGFSYWEGEGKEEGRNVSLREFESLSNLNSLEIRILDATLLPRIPLFSKLTKYTIVVDYYWAWPSEYQFHKQLKLKLATEIPSACGGINSLLNSTEYLLLEGKGSKDVVHELLRKGIEGLQHLKNLSISECDTPEYLANTMNLVPPLNSIAAPQVFPILESLDLHRLPNLREICHGQVPVGSFGKLSSIKISSCERLRNLFQLSIVGCLSQLKHLFIGFCDNMEEVICKEIGEDAYNSTNKIEFPKLESLTIYGLQRLIGFCRGIDEIEFPQLKELSLRYLPQLKCLFPNKSSLSSDSKGNHNAALISIFPPKVAFPNLEVVELEKLENLEEVGHHRISEGSLSKLREVTVRNCDKLINVFPSQLLARMRNLDKLIVEYCSLLEVVFELEGVDCGERNSEILSPLKCLIIKCLPKLNYISKRDPMGFIYIRMLDIYDSDSLRYLFSPTMTKSIPQLQKLRIGRCKLMSRIVAEENGLGESSLDEVEFPQLEVLELYDLPKLMSFFPKVITTVATSNDHLQNPVQHLFNEKVAFPRLEELTLRGLQNVTDIWCSELPTCSFSKLKILRLNGCGLIEEVFGFGSLNLNDKGGQLVKFTGLKLIELSQLDKLTHLCKKDHQEILLENLTYLRVSCCDNLRNMFSPSMARGLVHLQTLKIDGCLTMEDVVAKEEEGERRIDITLFPQLSELELTNLPKLRSFWHLTHSLELSQLGHVHVWGCPNMETFSLGLISTPKLRSVTVKVLGKKVWRDNLNITVQRRHDKKVWMDDLNSTIQQLFQQRGGEEEEEEGEGEEEQEEGELLVVERRGKTLRIRK